MTCPLHVIAANNRLASRDWVVNKTATRVRGTVEVGTVLAVLGHHWEVVTALVAKDLKVRYKGTVLGYLWSILQPLALMLIFTFIFKEIFKTSTPQFHLFLLSALFPWTWFASAITGAATSFVDNANLIKKVRFPRLLIPLAAILNHLVHFLLALPVYLVFLVAAGRLPSWSWLVGIPLLVVLQMAMVLGFSLVVASGNVYFRDVTYLVGVIMNLWFYATPVLYSLDMLSATVRSVLEWNPATHLMVAWRDLLLENRFDLAVLGMPTAISFAALAAGLLVFKRLERGFADVL